MAKQRRKKKPDRFFQAPEEVAAIAFLCLSWQVTAGKVYNYSSVSTGIS